MRNLPSARVTALAPPGSARPTVTVIRTLFIGAPVAESVAVPCRVARWAAAGVNDATARKSTALADLNTSRAIVWKGIREGSGQVSAISDQRSPGVKTGVRPPSAPPTYRATDL